MAWPVGDQHNLLTAKDATLNLLKPQFTPMCNVHH